jgi:class 3 adenylate cyclase/tetratricopeptide (TPR) repeat protein
MELLADRDPEDARKILDPVLEQMMEAVHRFEGTVNQVMGDGIMALFGAPLAQEDHAVRACYAALTMQEMVGRYAENVRRDEGVLIQIRIGLNSGEVVVRSVGSDLRMDYTAVGQTTHLAARMEQLAAPGTTTLTAETLRLVEGYVQVESLGAMKIKGLEAPAEVYQLVGAGAARTRLQAGALRGLTQFVGRDAETAVLCRAIEHAAEGRGQVVCVVGEPGVGKSRLYYEFLHSHRTQDWLVLEASSVSHGKAGVYDPLIELLKGYFRIEKRDDGRKIREKVAGKLLMLDRDLEFDLPALLFLLEAPLEDVDWLRLDPAQRRQRILAACKRLLIRESQVQGLVLVFEDLHWVDAETQALLDYLIESLATTRILLLANYRPEYRHQWSGRSYYTQVRIDPLDSRSAETLLSELLGDEEALAPLKRLLIERTEGNPLFLEESIRTLLSSGELSGTRGAYRLTTAVEAIQMGPTVQAILSARIDRLEPEDKRLLQAASVIGKDVPHVLLCAIAELSDEALRRGLSTLLAGEFLYEMNIFPELEYTFKHALTHDVAYDSVLQNRRRELHAQILLAIERVYAGRLDEKIEALAHHALRGEVWNKALTYLWRAGEKAVARAANRQAVLHFKRAIGVLSHLPQNGETLEQAVDLRLAMRWCWMPLGSLAQVAKYAREALPLAKALNDPRREALAHCSVNSGILGQSAQAIEHAQEAVAIAETLNDPTLRVISRWFLGRPYMELGAYKKAADCFLTDVGLGSQNIETYLMAHVERGSPYATFAVYSYGVAHGDASHCFAELGKFSEAEGHARQALEFAKKAGNLVLCAFHEAHLGFIAMRRGDYRSALRFAEDWLRSYGEAELLLPWQIMASRLGCIFNLCGKIPESIALFEKAQQFAQANHLVGFLQPELTWLAHAYSRAGREIEAVPLVQRALDLAREYEQQGNEAWTLYVQGEIHSFVSQPDRASDSYGEALELAVRLGLAPLQGWCLLRLGGLAVRRGAVGEGELQIEKARDMFCKLDMLIEQDQSETVG